ncbi:MAG TPA: hypothetical protein VL096_06450 [Pirellulaceae bacterium]|nr:hypothetical protein [Pirellulaceae bacterium]
MNADKLAKALKKELTRNAKKSIALALVTVVALWLWAPLAMKWFGTESPKARAKARKAAAAAKVELANADPASTTTPTAERPLPIVKSPAAALQWQELRTRLSHDENMQTATLPAASRDPFAVTKVEQQALPVEVPQDYSGGKPAMVTSETTPADLGLVLQGTLISTRSRRAVIAGRTYSVGDMVKPRSTDLTQTVTLSIEYQLTEVGPRHVVLLRNGNSYELKLVNPTLADGDQLTFDAQSDSR